MRSESGTKEGHAALLKLHRGAHLGRSSQNETRTKIVHSHRGSLCRRRPSRTHIDVPAPCPPEADSSIPIEKPEIPRSAVVRENRKRVFGYGYSRDSQKSLLDSDIDLDILDKKESKFHEYIIKKVCSLIL